MTPTINWIDRVVSYFNPRAGAIRRRARLIEVTLDEAMSKRKYEGAATGRRTDGWLTSGTSANAEVGPALQKLRARSRDLVRNNPYAARGIQAIASNVIGTGIVLQAGGEGKASGRAKVLTDLWRRWAETTECDADGRNDFYGLQALVMRTVTESGGAIVRRRRRKFIDGLTVPIQLQVLEPDFIDLTREGTGLEGGLIYQGVEFNAIGKCVAYWLYQNHPGDSRAISGSSSIKSYRVPASELRYIFRGDRPGQLHGVPWLAPVMIKLRDFDDFEDAQLTRQKIAACFTAFIRDIEMPDSPTTQANTLGETLEPGAMQQLPNGKTIEFANPPGVTGYGEYTSSVLHSIAIGFGTTYEVLTGDLRQVNYSSGRMGWIEFQRNIEQWRHLMVIPGFCQTTWDWFKEAATLAGAKTDGVTSSFTPPRREMIDPTKEVSATVRSIRAGLQTLSGAIRENGNDPDTHLAEWASDAKKIDDLGLILDSDPRKTMQAGIAQAYIDDAAGGTNPPEKPSSSDETN